MIIAHELSRSSSFAVICKIDRRKRKIKSTT